MRKLVLLTFAATLLAGCSNDTEPGAENDERVALGVIGGIQTRAHDMEWDKNDGIGIFMLNGTTVDDPNKQYVTVAGDANFAAVTNQTIYFPVSGESRDFVAYYPYRANLTDGSIYIVDVSNQIPQKDIDLMSADKVTGKDKEHPDVTFQFTHRLVKLDIAIKTGTGLDGVNLTGTTVVLTNQQTGGTYDVLKGIITIASGTAQEIVLSAATDGENYEGIVLPAVSTDGMILKFTVPALNGQTFTWAINKAAESQQFDSGKKYKYIVTIHKVGLTVTSGISPWDAGNGEGEEGSAE